MRIFFKKSDINTSNPNLEESVFKSATKKTKENHKIDK